MRCGALRRWESQFGRARERDNRWVIAVFAVIGLLDDFLPSWSDRKGIWSIDGDAVRWLGVTLFAVGGAIRLWPFETRRVSRSAHQLADGHPRRLP